jgi:hypothetical protein
MSKCSISGNTNLLLLMDLERNEEVATSTHTGLEGLAQLIKSHLTPVMRVLVVHHPNCIQTLRFKARLRKGKGVCFVLRWNISAMIPIRTWSIIPWVDRSEENMRQQPKMRIVMHVLLMQYSTYNGSFLIIITPSPLYLSKLQLPSCWTGNTRANSLLAL